MTIIALLAAVLSAAPVCAAPAPASESKECAQNTALLHSKIGQKISARKSLTAQREQFKCGPLPEIPKKPEPTPAEIAAAAAAKKQRCADLDVLLAGRLDHFLRHVYSGERAKLACPGAAPAAPK